MGIKLIIKIPKTPSSAQTVASIDDLLTEILLRLPIESLLRFKFVSKHWHSLITTPQFSLRYNPNPNLPIGLIFPRNTFRGISPKFEYVPLSTKNRTPPPFKKLNFTKDPSGITILQSCNGLMLCSSFQGHDKSRRYYIYNPTTKRFSKLPKLEPWPEPSRVHGMSLAFEPTKSPHYKVVCVWELEPVSDSAEYRYQIEVYSSDTGPWRECGEPFTSRAHFNSGVHWNGAIHWISAGQGEDSLYFNPDHDQAVQVMPMPPIPDGWDWRSNYYFGESSGHLHYVELLGPRAQFSVYEMKRDYSEWFVQYKVDLSHVVAAHPGMIREYLNPGDWDYYAYSVFSVVRDGKEEDDFLVLHIPGKVIRYNLVEKSFETVHEFEDEVKGCLEYPTNYGFQHIQSLCCV